MMPLFHPKTLFQAQQRLNHIHYCSQNGISSIPIRHPGLIQILIEKQSVFYREGCLKHQRQHSPQNSIPSTTEAQSYSLLLSKWYFQHSHDAPRTHPNIDREAISLL